MSKEQLLENWVFVPISLRTPPTFSPIFKVGSRTLFVDFPNSQYLAFLHNILVEASHMIRYEKRITNDLIVDLINRIKTIAKDFNSDLQRKGINWFKIVIKKMPPYGKALYLITYVIDYKKFSKFVEDFINGKLWDGSLAKRYEYIFSSKIYLVSEILKYKDAYEILEKLKYEVKLKVLNTLTEALKNTLKFRKYLDQSTYIILNTLPKYYPQDRLFIAHRLMERTYFAIQDFKHLIDNIQSLIDFPPLIFREFRKILEMLTLTLFEVTMFLRDMRNFYEIAEYIDLEQRKYLKYIIDLLYDQIALDVLLSWDNKEYFDKAREIAYIKSLDNVVERNIIEELHKVLNMSMNKTRKLIKRNISWTLLFILSSLRAKKVKTTMISVDEKVLDMMTHILSLFLAKDLTNNEKLLEEYSNKIYYTIRKLQKTHHVVYPVPSINFLIQYAEKYIKDSKVSKLYSDYCFFIHPYPSSMQLYPYTSILEYQMLPKELNKFYSVASKIIDTIINTMYEASSNLRKTYNYIYT